MILLSSNVAFALSMPNAWWYNVVAQKIQRLIWTKSFASRVTSQWQSWSRSLTSLDEKFVRIFIKEIGSNTTPSVRTARAPPWGAITTNKFFKTYWVEINFVGPCHRFIWFCQLSKLTYHDNPICQVLQDFPSGFRKLFIEFCLWLKPWSSWPTMALNDYPNHPIPMT